MGAGPPSVTTPPLKSPESTREYRIKKVIQKRVHREGNEHWLWETVDMASGGRDGGLPTGVPHLHPCLL